MGWAATASRAKSGKAQYSVMVSIRVPGLTKADNEEVAGRLAAVWKRPSVRTWPGRTVNRGTGTPGVTDLSAARPAGPDRVRAVVTAPARLAALSPIGTLGLVPLAHCSRYGIWGSH